VLLVKCVSHMIYIVLSLRFNSKFRLVLFSLIWFCVLWFSIQQSQVY
jgi:hypothetical protein